MTKTQQKPEPESSAAVDNNKAAAEKDSTPTAPISANTKEAKPAGDEKTGKEAPPTQPSRDFQAEIDDLQAENGNLSKALSESDDKIAALQDENKQARAALAEATNINESLSTEIERLTAELQDVRRRANPTSMPLDQVKVPDNVEIEYADATTPEPGDFMVSLDANRPCIVRGCETESQAIAAYNNFMGIRNSLKQHSVSKA